MIDKLSGVLNSFGFNRCHLDHSVFVKHTKVGVIILIVYVDDIINSSSDVDGIEEVKTKLKRKFQIKDLGKLRYFLGIEVARGIKGLILSQRKYVHDLLSEIDMLGSKPCDTPMDSNLKLDSSGSEEFKDKRRFRSLVGKLIYLTVTRPNITFVVGIVSQFMENPKQIHWDAISRVLKYLKGTIGMGVLYKKGSNWDIISYSDADWARSKSDRRSTCGYCTFVGGNLVTLRSKKQNVVARSSA